VSVIIPTFNERENIPRIAAAVQQTLAAIPHEIVFVDDDSTDGSLPALHALARNDIRVRYLQRIGRRGLSSAIIEGILSTSAPYIAVIDADLQHDERILPSMIEVLQQGRADIVVGSRYIAGGSVGAWDGKRATLSRLGTRVAKILMKADTSDPMSGFFAIRRQTFESVVRRLSGQGFKILLDICASANQPLRVEDIPYVFRVRQAGESKLDALVTWEYAMLLIDKIIGHIIPVRFISFLLVGSGGVLVHLLVLKLALFEGSAPFVVAQSCAAVIAMIFNFFVNNALTYWDRRLKGARSILLGLMSFIAVCSIGAVANVGVASFLFSREGYMWWLAGLCGIVVGAGFNYAMTSIVTWRMR
jgi:dolichol-phosphate mannosyltransferase